MYITINNNDEFVNYTFPILNLLSFAFMFFGFAKPGVLASILISIIFILYFKHIKIMFRGINFVFIIFLLICLVSGLNYIIIGYKDSILFFHGLSYNVTPMIMFFVGAVAAKKGNTKIIMYLLISNFLIIAIGLVLYYWEPNFYVKHYVSKLSVMGTYYRFPSYVGSLVVGNLTVISIPLLFMYRNTFSQRVFILFLALFILGSILTMQRASMVMLIFTLAITFGMQARESGKTAKYIKILIGALSVFTFMFLIYNHLFTDTQKLIFDGRISSINSAIGERAYQWRTAIEIASNYPFGTGIGSLGHKAVAAGFRGGVPDGNYFRILAEVGVLGLAVFILLNLLILFRTQKKNRYILLAIILYLFQAIGTNVFDIYYVAFIYWFLLGYAANCSMDNSIYLP